MVAVKTTGAGQLIVDSPYAVGPSGTDLSTNSKAVHLVLWVERAGALKDRQLELMKIKSHRTVAEAGRKQVSLAHWEANNSEKSDDHIRPEMVVNLACRLGYLRSSCG